MDLIQDRYNSQKKQVDSILLFAVTNCNLGLLADILLLFHGVRDDVFDAQGNSLLSHAARVNDIGIVKLLLALNFSPNTLNKDGSAPLHHAMMCRNLSVIDLLI